MPSLLLRFLCGCAHVGVLCVIVQALYHEAGWLALFIFGIPTVVIGIVCYALCCIEPVDDEEEEGLEGEDENSFKEESIEPPPKYTAVGTARLRKKGAIFTFVSIFYKGK